MVETLADFGLRAGASATSTGSPGENARKHGKIWQGCKMDQEKKPLPD